MSDDHTVPEPMTPGVGSHHQPIGVDAVWGMENDTRERERYKRYRARKGVQENEREMGPLRFELRTSAMSRRRHNQLDHEPA